jgi:hypothetical protein
MQLKAIKALMIAFESGSKARCEDVAAQAPPALGLSQDAN